MSRTPAPAREAARPDSPARREAPVVRPFDRPVPEALLSGRAFFVERADEAGGSVRLRCKLVRPSAPPFDVDPRGTVIVYPGRTEFIEKYFETADDLLARGFVVLITDPRGQGLSGRLTADPLKSYVARFGDYASDIGFIAGELADELPRPHILFGHSMGGLVVLQAVIDGHYRPDALVASAPMLGLFDVATPILKYGFRALDRLGLGERDLPFQKQERGIPVPFEGNKLTSDPGRFSRWAEYFQTTPPLRVAGPTIRWLAESVRAMDHVNRHARRLDVPSLLIAPGGDPIVDPASIREFAERAGADVLTIAGARHEVVMERDEYRTQFFDALDAFLEREGF